MPQPEQFDVVVIGGGQAGLSVGYHLAGPGIRFVTRDANERIGDAWCQRSPPARRAGRFPTLRLEWRSACSDRFPLRPEIPARRGDDRLGDQENQRRACPRTVVDVL
jgi:cation diffusion facilitator CzcD-associated flavoprotein CzcO